MAGLNAVSNIRNQTYVRCFRVNTYNFRGQKWLLCQKRFPCAPCDPTMAQVNMEMGKATTFVRAFSTSAYNIIEITGFDGDQI